MDVPKTFSVVPLAKRLLVVSVVLAMAFLCYSIKKVATVQGPIGRPDELHSRNPSLKKAIILSERTTWKPGDIFVFSHVPKAAGTSATHDFQHILQESTQLGNGTNIACNDSFVYQRYTKEFRDSVAGKSICNIVAGEVNVPSIRESNPAARIGMMIRSPIMHTISALDHLDRQHRLGGSLDVEHMVETLDLKAVPRFTSWLTGYSFSVQWKKNITLSLRIKGENTSTERRSGIQWQSVKEGTVKESFSVLKGLWWFGVVEYYQESMCLLRFQSGTFDQTKCACEDKRTKRNVLPKKLFLPSGLVQRMWTARKRDEHLYALAVNLFLERVARAEKELGFKFLCVRS